MKTISVADPEFEEVLLELQQNAAAVRARARASEASLREWLYDFIRQTAHRLGYRIQDLAELAKDIGHGFREGIREGRQAARDNSIRNRERQG